LFAFVIVYVITSIAWVLFQAFVLLKFPYNSIKLIAPQSCVVSVLLPSLSRVAFQQWLIGGQTFLLFLPVKARIR